MLICVYYCHSLFSQWDRQCACIFYHLFLTGFKDEGKREAEIVCVCVCGTCLVHVCDMYVCCVYVCVVCMCGVCRVWYMHVYMWYICVIRMFVVFV